VRLCAVEGAAGEPQHAESPEATAAASSPSLVAFVSRAGAFPHARLQPGMLLREAGCCPRVLLRLKGMCRMRSNLITPLVVLGWAALVCVTHFSPRLTLHTREHKAGCGLGIPCPSGHG
jgi:hypothetical protein